MILQVLLSFGLKQCNMDMNMGGQVSRTLTSLLESLVPTQAKSFKLIN